MTNYLYLEHATAVAQQQMMSSPIIEDVVAGSLELAMYIDFLTNAYHHVRHTVPLMMAAGARIGVNHPKLVASLKEYIEEEIGHEYWILDDLDACGADADVIANSSPKLATELLVSYVRDYIYQVNPCGFFGMVHVLEGTSTSLATLAADRIQIQLGLSNHAFKYLRSHGSLDTEHVAFFKDMLDLLDKAQMSHVIHVANRVYYLYGEVLRSVPRTVDGPVRNEHVA